MLREPLGAETREMPIRVVRVIGVAAIDFATSVVFYGLPKAATVQTTVPGLTGKRTRRVPRYRGGCYRTA